MRSKNGLKRGFPAQGLGSNHRVNNLHLNSVSIHSPLERGLCVPPLCKVSDFSFAEFTKPTTAITTCNGSIIFRNKTVSWLPLGKQFDLYLNYSHLECHAIHCTKLFRTISVRDNIPSKQVPIGIGKQSGFHPPNR